MLKVLMLFALLQPAAWQSKPSEHFVLYYQSGDRPVVNELLLLLENEYFRLSRSFDAQLSKPVRVFVHPDRSSLIQATGMEKGSEWLVGVAINDSEIHLISPLSPPGNHTEESVKQGLIHELVHIFVAGSSKKRLPLWLNEGLAVYLAGQSHFARQVPVVLRNRTQWPRLQEFADPELFEKRNGYVMAYSIVEFMLNSFGMPAVANFVRNYPDYSLLGVRSALQMEADWQAYLESNYLNPPDLPRWLLYQSNVFDARLNPENIRDQAKLEFFTGENGNFRILVLDAWGKVMQVLLQRPLSNGFHEVEIDGSRFLPGIYYLEMQMGQKIQLIRFTCE